jgi:predicted NBD/HSP70 family sugar kinase
VPDLKLYAAVDIGGTNIKYGIVDGNGNVLSNFKKETEANLGGVVICKKVCDIIEELSADCQICGVGISTAGVVDSQKGVIVYANSNLPNYIGTNWNDIIKERFHLPTFVLNDVHAAGAAEAWVGAGRGVDNFVCAAVGTGIGGCVFINGEPFFGPHFRAAALGYMSTGGSEKIYEQKASTSALVRNIEKLSGERDVNGKNAFSRARDKNPVYENALSSFYDELAKGLANCIFCYDPEMIIIGGAISNEGQPLLKSLYSSLKKYVPEEFLCSIKLRTAGCTNNAGMIGAVYGLIKSGNCEL